MCDGAVCPAGRERRGSREPRSYMHLDDEWMDASGRIVMANESKQASCDPEVSSTRQAHQADDVASCRIARRKTRGCSSRRARKQPCDQ